MASPAVGREKNEMLPDVQVPPNAASGIAELDDILGGGFSRESVFLIEGKPGTGKTTIALQFLMAGAAAGRARPSYHPLGNGKGAAARCGVARLGARRADRGGRAGAGGEPARPGPAAEPALLVRSRARRDDTAYLRCRGALGAAPGRARQPVRDPPPGTELAALPATDPGAQALLRQAGLAGRAPGPCSSIPTSSSSQF